MKFLFAATLLLATSSDAFLAPSNRAVSGNRHSNNNALKMAETDEVTKLREMAAKLRGDADRLNKVSSKLLRSCFSIPFYFILFSNPKQKQINKQYTRNSEKIRNENLWSLRHQL